MAFFFKTVLQRTTAYLLLNSIVFNVAAEQITFKFEGKLTYVSAEPEVAAVFEVGRPFKVSYSFDPSEGTTISDGWFNIPAQVYLDYDGGVYVGSGENVFRVRVDSDLRSYEAEMGNFIGVSDEPFPMEPVGFPALGELLLYWLKIDLRVFSSDPVLFTDRSFPSTLDLSGYDWSTDFADKDLSLLFQPSTVDDGAVIGEIDSFSMSHQPSFDMRRHVRFRATPLEALPKSSIFALADFSHRGDLLIPHFVRASTPLTPSLLQCAIIRPDGGFQKIPPLDFDESNVGGGMNRHGDAVGTSFLINQQPNPSQRDAFLYTAEGDLKKLPFLEHGSEAFDISDGGLIAGRSFTDSEGNHDVAVIWTPDGGGGHAITNLGSFGRNHAVAYAVSDHGYIYVAAFDQGTNFRYLVTDLSANIIEELEDSATRFLGNGELLLARSGRIYNPVTDTYSETRGEWIGDANSRHSVIDGNVLWHPEAGVLTEDVSPLVETSDGDSPIIDFLIRINERGQIVARAKNSDHAWLLTPVPQVVEFRHDSEADAVDLWWFALGDDYTIRTSETLDSPVGQLPVHESGIFPDGLVTGRSIPVAPGTERFFLTVEQVLAE